MKHAGSAGVLALALLPGLLGVVPGAAAASNSTAPDVERRAPQWRAPLDGTENQTVLLNTTPNESVLDPVSGDVFTLFWDSLQADAPRRIRRTDGDTGATIWEIGLGPSYLSATELTMDATGERLVVAVSGGRGHQLTSIGLDGQVDWTVTSKVGGDVMDLETNPVTGTTCFTTMTQEGKRNAWRLVCHDRDGKSVQGGRTIEAGRSYGPTALAVDPALGTWYVAGAHRRKKGSRTVLVAYQEDLGRLWKRSQKQSRGATAINSIAVDPGNHAVHLGGRTRAGATLFSWNAKGRFQGRRSWSTGHTIAELVTDGSAHRLIAAMQDRDGGTSILVTRNPRKKIRRFDHAGRWNAGVRLAVDPDRKEIFVAGSQMAAYRWNGKRLWRTDATKHQVADVVIDGARGRVVTLSTNYDEVQQRTVSLLTLWSD